MVHSGSLVQVGPSHAQYHNGTLRIYERTPRLARSLYGLVPVWPGCSCFSKRATPAEWPPGSRGTKRSGPTLRRVAAVVVADTGRGTAPSSPIGGYDGARPGWLDAPGCSPQRAGRDRLGFGR